MYRDQIELQAEVDALDKHMANLNNQNYCLQKELESFIEADEEVRRGLDRKNQVEAIRNKVDDVIRRSQAEVQKRGNMSKEQLMSRDKSREDGNFNRISKDEINYSKGERKYSPLRERYDAQDNRNQGKVQKFTDIMDKGSFMQEEELNFHKPSSRQ